MPNEITFRSKNLVTGPQTEASGKMSDLFSPMATSTKKKNIKNKL